MTTSVVIFDLDGVLVDSEPLWREGFRAALEVIAASVGAVAPVLSDDDLRTYEGGRVPDTVATLAGELFDGLATPETLSDAVEVAVATASRLFAQEPVPIAASVRAAHELHARGFRLGVASSSAPEFIRTVLEHLDLTDEVEVVASAFHLANPKPHPDVYQDVLDRMGVAAEESLAVEDSWTGVRAALGAGLRTVWLTTQPPDFHKDRVRDLFDRDPGSTGSQRPQILFVAELEADAVQEFSEA